MKQTRLHFSDIAIPVVTAGLIALCLSRWQPLPKRVLPGGFFADAKDWPAKEEAALAAISETARPREWARQATRLADVYGILGRHGEEADLMERSLKIREQYRREEEAKGRRLSDDETPKLVRDLADLYARTGQPAKALPLQKQWLESSGDMSTKISAYVEISRTQRTLGMDADAMASLYKALKLKFPNPKQTWTPDSITRQWLEDYRDLLTKSGKTPEEVAQTVRDQFGQ